MPDHDSPQDFEGARRDMGLTQSELWVRYFALGGAAMPAEFEAFVVGALDPERAQHDILVHALNERSMELGLVRRWTYSEES
jgi:hypothetical protein